MYYKQPEICNPSQCVKEHPDEPCPHQIVYLVCLLEAILMLYFIVNLQTLLNNRWLVCN